MGKGADLAIREAEPLQPTFDITPEEAKRALQAIRQFQIVVRSEMIQGHDFGVIPGTDKPTLFKPGAEKLAKLMKCTDRYDVEECKEDWEKPFFYYRIKAQLVIIGTDFVISEGVGSANSFESKWRYRWLFPSDVPEGVDKKSLKRRELYSKKKKRKYVQYRVENEDIFDQVNTILKMAKKRALVDAALSAGRLSDIFTQDLEDMNVVEESEGEDSVPEEPEKKEPEKASEAPAPEPEAAELADEEQLFAQIRETLEAAGHDPTFIEKRMEGLKPQKAAALKKILANEKQRLKNGNGKANIRA